MNRLDFRTLETFKKDILFSTQLEEFWFKLYLTQILPHYDLVEYENTGTDNTGAYKKRASKDPDYTVHLTKGEITHSRKLDIKWAPTSGKATFKVNNLKHYIKNDINILLFYNIGEKRFNKRKDYDLKAHLDILKKNINNIRYGVIIPAMMEDILKTYEHKINYYMGNKMCVVVPSKDFNKYFQETEIK